MRSHAVPFRITRTLLCRHALRWVALSLLLVLGQAVPSIAKEYAYVTTPSSIKIYPIISSPGGPSDRTLGQPTSKLLPEGLYALTIRLSRDGGNAYVATVGRPLEGSWLLRYAVDRTSGALTLQDKVPATLATGGLAISEKHVCMAHAGGSPFLPPSPYYAISCFARDPQNGALRRVETFALSTRPADLTFGHTDEFLYTTLYNSNAVGMLRLNPATGKLSWLVPPTVSTKANPIPIVCNPIYPLCYEGNTAYQGTVGFYPINRDGTLNTPRVVQAGLYPAELAVHHSGKFLVVVNATSSTVMVFDAITGQLRATNPTGASPQALAFDPIGRPEGPVVYVASRASSTISTFTIENGTGRLTLRGVVNAPTHPNSIATTPRLPQ